MWLFAPSWSRLITVFSFIKLGLLTVGLLLSRQYKQREPDRLGIYQPRPEWRIDMAESTVKEATNGGTKISHWDSSLKDIVSAVEDYADATRRAARRGRLAAEDLMDEAAHSVKQRPLQIVALTFGLAFGTGVLFGWIASRTYEK
jgi:hypothetical protein